MIDFLYGAIAGIIFSVLITAMLLIQIRNRTENRPLSWTLSCEKKYEYGRLGCLQEYLGKKGQN